MAYIARRILRQHMPEVIMNFEKLAVASMHRETVLLSFEFLGVKLKIVLMARLQTTMLTSIYVVVHEVQSRVIRREISIN
jgi:hypothetical protein